MVWTLLIPGQSITGHNKPPSIHDLTQQWDSLQHGGDLLHGPLTQAAFVAEATEAVDPTQQRASLSLGLSVELLQQLGGYREVALE